MLKIIIIFLMVFPLLIFGEENNYDYYFSESSSNKVKPVEPSRKPTYLKVDPANKYLDYLRKKSPTDINSKDNPDIKDTNNSKTENNKEKSTYEDTKNFTRGEKSVIKNKKNKKKGKKQFIKTDEDNETENISKDNENNNPEKKDVAIYKEEQFIPIKAKKKYKDIKIGAFVGPIYNKPSDSNASSKWSLGSLLLIDYPLSKTFSISPGIGYIRKEYENSNSIMKLDYIKLMLLGNAFFNYKIDNQKLILHSFIGISSDTNLSNQYTHKSSGNNYSITNDYVNKTQPLFILGFGSGTNIFENNEVFIDLYLNIPFGNTINENKRRTYSLNDNRIMYINILLGWKMLLF